MGVNFILTLAICRVLSCMVGSGCHFCIGSVLSDIKLVPASDTIFLGRPYLAQICNILGGTSTESCPHTL